MLRVCILRSHLHNVEFLPVCFSFSSHFTILGILQSRIPPLPSVITPSPCTLTLHISSARWEHPPPINVRLHEIPVNSDSSTRNVHCIACRLSATLQDDGNTLVLYSLLDPPLLYFPFNIVWRKCQNSCFQNPRQATRGEARDACLG